MAKTLIAFFSRADENYFGGAMRYVKVGNTEIVANIRKDLTGAEVKKGLAIIGSAAANSKSSVERWLSANGLL